MDQALYLIVLLISTYFNGAPVSSWSSFSRDTIQLGNLISGESQPEYDFIAEWDEIIQFNIIEGYGSIAVFYFIINDEVITEQRMYGGFDKDRFLDYKDGKFVLDINSRNDVFNINIGDKHIGIERMSMHYHHNAKSYIYREFDLRPSKYDILMGRVNNKKAPILGPPKFSSMDFFIWKRPPTPREFISWAWDKVILD